MLFIITSICNVMIAFGLFFLYIVIAPLLPFVG